MDIGTGGKPHEQHGKIRQLDRGLAILTVLIFSLIGCIPYGRHYSSVAPGIPASPPTLTIQSVNNQLALERVAAVWQLKSKTVTQVPPLAVRWPAPIFWSYDQPLTITWHSSDPPSFIILLMYSRSGLSKAGIPATRHLFMCAPNESQRQSGGCRLGSATLVVHLPKKIPNPLFAVLRAGWYPRVAGYTQRFVNDHRAVWIFSLTNQSP
ncbi:MAG: hypothetical protein OWR62_15755 [Sulfobacillus thermotolerans]|nr:hypothetical protein [Sulfobacillus thermotolerans]